MASGLPLYCRTRRLLGNPAIKVHGHLRDDASPVLAAARPRLRYVHHRKIQHLEQAVVCREYRLRLRDFAKLPVEPLYGVGRVYEFPYLLRVFEVCDEVRPAVAP